MVKEKTEELIKIFVTNIKTAKKKIVIQYSTLVFSFDVGRSMFDVGRSSLETSPHGINPPLRKGEAVGIPITFR
jgi:hypothetical protein